MKNKKLKPKSSTLWVYFTLSFIATFLVIIFVALTIMAILHANKVITPGINFTSMPFITLFVVSLLLGVVFSALVGRTIVKPITKLSSAMSQVATGDFSVRLEIPRFTAEIEEMYSNFNQMAEELSSIETLRTDFIVNVSHEFKTPLSAIEGYATLLQSEKLTKAQRDEYIDKVILNTHRLSTLTGNILQLSKLENQKAKPEVEDYDLAEQIRQTILSLESKWEAKKLDLDIELPEMVVKSNESLLNQVWYNLLSNAIKFTPEGGKIKIEAHESDSRIIVIIADSGLGISKEDQRHVFDKFYQGDKAHSGEGNGLGLALVQKIINVLEAKIEVQSEVGKGTMFKVTLHKELSESDDEQ